MEHLLPMNTRNEVLRGADGHVDDKVTHLAIKVVLDQISFKIFRRKRRVETNLIDVP